MSTSRVLLIFDDCGPGDAVAANFALGAVRAALPNAEIVVLVGQQAFEILNRSTVPDRVVMSRLYVPVHRRTLRARIEKLREMVRLVQRLGRGYDLAVTFFWGTLALNVVAYLVARRRIGYANRLGLLQSNKLGAYDPFSDGVTQNVALLAASGIEPRPAVLAPLGRLRADAVVVEALLVRHKVKGGVPIAVLHAGSDWACQQWSIASWAALADAVIDQYGVHVLWTGGQAERSYVEQIRSSMRNETVSVCGETNTVGELSALLAAATLCISVDSLPWELAVAEGIPAVVLSGPSVPSGRLVAAGQIVVLNRTRSDLRRTIVRCQASFPHGVCHDYTCPLSQLRSIKVEDVLRQVAATGALNGNAVQAASR